ncbi:unnamed protein product [Soboliphyme baturini]|uniref:B2-adapt-app_C domain-containing protein n=1 Tax=Soboliphyme baturini TaxID=241478 RepID=A0A183IWF9_9BILA|nr:unnamed protein product [Soboliphyme baturini]
MIWIIGEYAERIDNADELLESFLESFNDENTQVQLQLLTAIVKLFLKRPADTQELVQRVLSLTTQDSDNPDLRDRGYIYWRLLSADPAAAKEVVLAEKPLISEETDLLEPTLLNELMCHIGSLASVYHKPPSAFMENVHVTRKTLQTKTIIGGEENDAASTAPQKMTEQPTVIPAQDSLIADLLNLDLSPAPAQSYTPAPVSSGLDDLLGLGSEGLLGSSANNMASTPSPVPGLMMDVPTASTQSVLTDIFGAAPIDQGLVLPKQTDMFWGFEAVEPGADYFRLTVLRFGFLQPKDGQMDKRLFLQAWKDIPAQNEVQYSLNNTKGLSADAICAKLQLNNVFTVARRNVDNQELLYHSLKLTNGISVLSELKMQPNNEAMTLSLKSRNLTVTESIQLGYALIIQQ